MPEPDAERLEERLLEDEELFQALRGVEDDLIDEFARGTLDASLRLKFLERRGWADRVPFARALSKRVAPTNVIRSPALRWIPLAAAAALVVAIGGTVLVPHQPPERARGLSAPNPTPGAFASVALTLGTSRSAQGATEVTMPKDARGLQLRIRLDPADRFELYAVELRASSGSIVWHADDVVAATEGGELVLQVTAPVLVTDASYEVAVRGLPRHAAPEDLGFVTLELRRAP